MFRPFSESAATLELPPVPDALPFDEMLAHDWELGVVYPALELSKVKNRTVILTTDDSSESPTEKDAQRHGQQ
jgi:hypothetical protein